MKLKLDYKKTIKVGFAFAIIMIFWTAYDFVVPYLLDRAFGLSNAMRGLVMGLDNLLSLSFCRYSENFGQDKVQVWKTNPFHCAWHGSHRRAYDICARIGEYPT